MLDQFIGSLKTTEGCLLEIGLCYFDKSLTPGSLAFIVFVFLATAIALTLLKKVQEQLAVRFAIMASGVLLFELFTAPMWNTYHLGNLGYFYLDLSWILTTAWTTAFLSTVTAIDHFFKSLKERQRFFLYLPVLLLVTVIGEWFLVNIGVRGYAPEIINQSIGFLSGVPIEVFYYAPVFSSFVICFYKFWSFHLDKISLIPVKKVLTLRNVVIILIGVFLFELLIEPLINNLHFPAWSYVYKDISLVRIGLWIVLIATSTTIIDKLFVGLQFGLKFVLYVSLPSLLFFQLESWLINHGFRVYSASARANFTGFVTPISHIPMEVALAIPIYITLIITFVRYWRIVLDNRL